MSIYNIFRLLLLACIWGVSFLMMKVIVVEIDPMFLVWFRIASGAVFLLIVGRMLGEPVLFVKNWKNYVLVGSMNSVIPFFCFAYAALTTPSSILVVVNSTVPLWAALIAFVLLRQKLQTAQVIGLLCGVVGVALLVDLDFNKPWGAASGIVLALIATLLYALSAMYSKHLKIAPLAMAQGCLLITAILYAIPSMWYLPTQMPSIGVMMLMLVIGIVCTGFAYILYFGLINDVGTTNTLTLVFIMPIVGVLVGWGFADETLSIHALFGMVCILFGAAFVIGIIPRPLKKTD